LLRWQVLRLRRDLLQRPLPDADRQPPELRLLIAVVFFIVRLEPELAGELEVNAAHALDLPFRGKRS